VFFQVMGFHTEQKAPRLISLSDIGTNGSPKALVMCISPGENFDEIISELDWLSYLFYAANFHNVNWGFLTNGFEMRVFDFRRNDYREIFLSVNLDGIIRDERLDSFSTIYKILSYMRGRKGAVLPDRRVRKPPKTPKPVSSEYDLAYHTTNIPQSTLNLFEALRVKILALSASITEKYGKLYIGYSSPNKFCEICVLKSRLKVWVALSIDEFSDPHSLCRDVRNIGHWGTGDSELTLQNSNDVDAVFEIVRQAYNKSCCTE
jgi:predicted transport protein